MSSATSWEIGGDSESGVRHPPQAGAGTSGGGTEADFRGSRLRGGNPEGAGERRWRRRCGRRVGAMPDAVIVGGGDGTVAAAATIFAGQDKPLGILPLGTFNLAARDVGMPLDWQEAAKLLVTAPVRRNGFAGCGGKAVFSAWWFGVLSFSGHGTAGISRELDREDLPHAGESAGQRGDFSAAESASERWHGGA